MGIGNGIFVILEASIPWGKEQDRTAGNERERDRVRDTRDLKGLGPWEHGGKTHMVEFHVASGQKVIIRGGFFLLSSFFIAETEFRRVRIWPKRALHGE